ncbi:hypothetical protein [Flavobacterium sp. WC2509]|uniref:hypothetical protein n=1 Tax=Flavobacterium sp. WC2509 TaxID=3461406 RepID=UPI004044F4D1
MKYLIYTLLFSTVVFSQNYYYAGQESSATSDMKTSFNQWEETVYFNSYLLPLSRKSELQSALDTYGSVRLEEGDYREGGLQSITLKSNMKLFGHHTYNVVPEINIAAGSDNVMVASVKLWYGLNFLSGEPITNCIVSHVTGGDITSTNASVELCIFFDIIGTNLLVDNTSSGYFRNNYLIKHWITSVYPELLLKGNNTTPSYNNIWVWLNLLTAHGDATDIDNFGNIHVIGLDAEAWNYENLGTGKALLYMRNMKDVRLTGMTGSGYATNSTAVFDIQSESLTLLDKKITTSIGPASVTTAKTLTVNSTASSSEGSYNVTGGNYDIRGYFNDNLLAYNGASQTSTITDPVVATNIKNSLLGSKRQPWPRPIFPEIADPAGINWKSERVGKPSSRAYIQGLIDTNGIANLPEGIYYIDAPLLVNKDEGIIGSGTGKTVIIGLTDDFNLINVRGSGIGTFIINYLTLEGGDKGVNITSDGYDVWFQPNAINFKFVVFRNQATYGIEVAQLYGMDNCMFQQVHFFNIPVGFKQTADPNYGGFETNHMTYIDKTVFYKCQAINCGTGFSLRTARGDNLNAWVNCNFDGNTNSSIDFVNHNAPLVVNCDFKHSTGNNIINSNYTIGIYSCDFSNNSTNSIINGDLATIEGCNFLDDIPLFGTINTAYVVDSIVTGSTTAMSNGLFINSSLLANPSLSKLLVNINSGVPTVLLDEGSNPYPQLLVTHKN